MAVVKAGAYGSASETVAKRLEELGVDYLAVAYAEEGEVLRSYGIKIPIMVFYPQLDSLKLIIISNNKIWEMKSHVVTKPMMIEASLVFQLRLGRKIIPRRKLWDQLSQIVAPKMEINSVKIEKRTEKELFTTKANN